MSTRVKLAKRVVRIAAILLASVALAYIVGVNVFLRTRLFRDAIGYDPDSLLVDYDRAYSLWPGRVHAEGLSIRGRDTHVEWILRIEQCDFRVSVGELANRRFHAEHVRGDGVSLRLRRRQDRVTPAWMSAVPPIPGFLDPPLTDVGPPSPPLTDATYNLWSIQLDDVVARGVHEVWIDTVRYAGEMEVHGRWMFRPLRWLDVGPADLEVRTLDVSFGVVEPWATGVAGRLRVTVHPLSLVTVPGADILDRVSVHGGLGGTAWIAHLANRALDAHGLKTTRAEAVFELQAEVDHGVLGPSTHVRTEPFPVQAVVAGFVLDGSVQADGRVDGDGAGYADLRVAAARVVSNGGARLTVTALAARLTSRNLDFGPDLFSDTVYAIEVDRAETESLAAWRAYLPLPRDIEVASGPVTVGARVHGALRPQTVEGQVSLGVPALSVSRGNTRLAADVSGAIQVKGSLQNTRVDLSGSSVAVRALRGFVSGARWAVPRLDAGARDLVVARAGATGRVTLDAPEVQLPSLAAFGPLLPLPSDVSVEGGRGTARVHMDVDVARLAGNGAVTMTARQLRLRVAGEHVRGDLTAVLRAKQSGSVTDISGTEIVFESGGGANATPETLDWWGRLRLQQASLCLRPSLRFSTRLSAAAKDGAPLTALVADNTAIPKWLIEIVSTKRLRATGEVLVTPSVLAVRSVEAHAQGADFDFELGKIRSEKPEWALLLDLGAAVAGVDVTEGHTQVLLFGARPWYRAKVESIQADERRFE